MYTVLGPFVLTEDSCSIITFSLSAFKSESQYKGSIWKIYVIIYDIYCEKDFLPLLQKELLFIHTKGYMSLFYKKDILFYFTRKACPGKSWKDLEFESVRLVGAMVMTKYCQRILKNPAPNILKKSGIVMYQTLNRDLHVRVWTNYLV